MHDESSASSLLQAAHFTEVYISLCHATHIICSTQGQSTKKCLHKNATSTVYYEKNTKKFRIKMISFVFALFFLLFMSRLCEFYNFLTNLKQCILRGCRNLVITPRFTALDFLTN